MCKIDRCIKIDRILCDIDMLINIDMNQNLLYKDEATYISFHPPNYKLLTSFS